MTHTAPCEQVGSHSGHYRNSGRLHRASYIKQFNRQGESTPGESESGRSTSTFTNPKAFTQGQLISSYVYKFFDTLLNLGNILA